VYIGCESKTSDIPGIRAEYLALRKAQSDENGGFGGESRREDRRDKCGTSTARTYVDIVYGTGGVAGRGVPTYDGYPSGGVRYRFVPSRRRVSIAYLFAYHLK